ncbi:hypothetical protein [Capnocytophaga sp.]|uniref:hypothetical protein n=1 Tax=Capnocytophaga sp. TaxID=44737 RepID=UPI0026DDA275|nr:hypothetical protein [Capnocytophaga sp.]MDO5105698.1 hypothetical protein [Capnocytophaga sp.]
MKAYISILIISFFFIGCKSDQKLSVSDAENLISAYLEEKPLYETGKFNTDKQRFENPKDKELIEAIEKLVDDGFVEITNEKVRKKWFSKDSLHIIEPVLTKRALPYIVSHNKKSSVVKTIIYKLNEKQITIEKSNEKTAVCSVILDKEKTPFYHFGKDPNPKTTFVSRKFKLKYNENSGWKIVK